MSLFSKTKGAIKYFSLEKWWKTLNEDEKNIILATYKNGNSCDLIKNKISKLNESSIVFLSNLAKWFEKPETYNIALKIIDKCEDLIKSKPKKFKVTDICYFYNTAIQIHYRNRVDDSEALKLAENYCIKQLSLINDNKNIELSYQPIGYQRLVSIYDSRKE
ncbi:MAG: hypothetical protein IJH34_16310, partial [Romboutsia sp.]|nr:hypothetical protein [Romboutsia sp.]